MSSSKKLTCKGTLLQVYQLKIANFLLTFSHVGIFNPALWSVLSPSLWFNSPPRRSFTLCIWPDSEPTKLLDHPIKKLRRGGGLKQINTCRKVPLQAIFLDDNILHWLLWALKNDYIIAKEKNGNHENSQILLSPRVLNWEYTVYLCKFYVDGEECLKDKH